jgi:hypothetical protein
MYLNVYEPGLQYEHGINRFRPALAAALPTLGAVATPLQRAFNALTVQIDTTIRKAQMASRNLTHLHQVPFVKHG